MKRPLRFSAASLALLGCLATARGQHAAASHAPESAAVDPDEAWYAATRNGLEAVLTRATRDGFFGAILVMRDGRTLLRKATGNAMPNGGACEPDTLFDLASVSKQFTAAAILVLQARGRLSLRDRLDRFFRDLPEDKAAIRLEHLLAHVAGFPQNIAADAADLEDRARWLRRALATPLVGMPGERFVYSNAGYGVLAAIVELVSKQRFEVFMHDSVFGPAGMVDASFVGSARNGDPRLDRAARRSTGLADERFGDTALVWPWHWGFRGASGVVATVDELYRWDRALYDDRVLPPRERRLLLEPHRRNYAGGLEKSLTAQGTVRQAHSGSVHGFQSWFARYPEENGFATVLGNERFVISTLADGIEQTMFAAGAPPSLLSAVVGRFRTADGQRVELRVTDGRLRAACAGTALAARAAAGAAESDRLGARAGSSARRMALKINEVLAHRASASSTASRNAGQTIAATLRAIELAETRILGARFLCFCADEHEAWFALELVGREQRVVARTDTDGKLTELVLRDGSPPLPEVTLDWRTGRTFAGTSRDGLERIVVRVADDGSRLFWRDRDGETALAREP